MCLLRRAVEKFELYPKTSTKSLDKAMKTLADSWKAVTKETLINCFRKTGIYSDIQQAVIANWDYPFKEIRKKFVRVKINWSINCARKCYCWENSKFRWWCYKKRSLRSCERYHRRTWSLPINRSWRGGEQWWRRKFNWVLVLSKERKALKIKSLICSWYFEDAAIYRGKGDEMQSIIFKFGKLFNTLISRKQKFQFLAIFSLLRTNSLDPCEFEIERVHCIYKLLHFILISNIEW